MSDQIYIVDDDDGHAELIASNLRDAGVANDLVRFANGFDVLDAISEGGDSSELPVLVLLDLNMPGMHGTKVLEELRRSDRTKSVPIVILTTSANSPEIDECYKLGCNLFLTKPIQYEEFVRVIRLLGLVFKVVKLPSGSRR